MKVIELFSGVGGLSYGFLQAGFEIVLANEIDSSIASSYVANHPNTVMINKDITSIDIKEVFEEYKGKIDVVIGGPPCQGFSQKGNRKSINDERNFLFLYYFKVVEYLRPKYFLLENVPNILTVESGYFKHEIEHLFSSIGYAIDMDILNAKFFGVPQSRRRAFVLGKLGDSKLHLPIGNYNPVTVKDAISDLAYYASGEGSEISKYRFTALSEYQRLMREDSFELYNHVVTNHSKSAIEKLKLIPEGMGKEVLPKHLLTKSSYSGTWSRLLWDEQSVTITTRFDTPSSGRFTHPTLNRCITVREAARLQSFPDKFIFHGNKSSQMKQVGNAVPPLLAYAIACVIKTDNS